MSEKISKTMIVSMIFGELEPGVILQVTHTYASANDLLEAIRGFVRGWAQAAEGKQAQAEAGKDFNWGDFAEWATILREKIPGVLDIVEIYPAVNGNFTAAIVDHDELLMGAAPETGT
jgi:hypothetical protein